MTRILLSWRSTRHYAWSHLSVLAGIVLTVAVLVGALLVGDSIRFTLRESALLRLGGAHYALDMKGRYFPADLASRLQAKSRVAMAPVLLLRGVAIGPARQQVNNVQIAGIDDRFMAMGRKCPGRALAPDEIGLNVKLAAALGVKPGDMVSIRFSRPSLLPHDAPLSSRKGDDTIRGTFTVGALLGDDESGRFSLQANQVVPCNAFVSLASLQKLAGLEGKANVLLAGKAESEEMLDRELKDVWRLEDAGFRWRNTADASISQLESERVMLDPAVGRAVEGMSHCVGTLTYLVNSIGREGGTNSTPYSFVIAMPPGTGLGVVPPGMKDNEILVNRWLAGQLGLAEGAAVRMAYYEFTPGGRLVETSRVFRVHGIVAMESLLKERELAPRFPGLMDAGRCADWDIGMPLDEKKMEDKPNEDYWESYRDTPKAIVTLRAGQAMWANRFGNLTGIRIKGGVEARAAMEESLRKGLAPRDLGFAFMPVRRIALKAAGEAMDFGQLFLGMSGFVMIAALMLTALLFSFSIQQRSRETGLLLAVGFRPGHIRWLLIQEGLWVAVIGGLLGAGLGMLYTRALIWGLGHSWQGAVASMAIQFHAEPGTVITGLSAGIAMALLALVVATWRQTKRPAHELLVGMEEGAGALCPGSKVGIMSVIVPGACLVLAAVLVLLGVFKPPQAPAEIFFAAGSLLLISALGWIRLYIIRLARQGGRLSLASLGIRNLGRRRTRSLTVAGLLAIGCFMVFAVSSMQEDIGKSAGERTSGTGGFALYGESSIPVLADLASDAGWKKLRLDEESALAGVTMVPVKVRDGDDASCLNLNRAQSPRLLGVDPDVLNARGAFAAPWSLLKEPLVDGCVPGLVGDLNTAQWGLQKKVGDVLLFTDERGTPFKVKLVGSLPMRVSVFQGSILIPVSAFSSCFPSESGSRLVLVDVPRGREQAVRECLSGKLGKFGLDIMPAVDRLREFHEAESAYLAMFLVLGGLGLLLGSAGMAIVVLRVIRERRAELALLKAVGYSDRQVRRMIATEHRVMLGLGLAAGIVSSLAAMWPNLHGSAVELPILTMLLFLAGITLFHLVWIELSIRQALRGSLVPALRGE